VSDELCECPTCGRMHRNLGFGRPPGAGGEPARIVVGLLEGGIDRAEEARVITLAAAAVAVMAVIGNGDTHLVSPALRSVVSSFQGLGEDARNKLSVMVEELIQCARDGKPFVGLARFADPPPASASDRKH